MEGDLGIGGYDIENAGTVTTTNLTMPVMATMTYTGAVPFLLWNPASGRFEQAPNATMETYSRTIMLTGTATEVQALIDGAGKYIPTGVTLAFQFSDGTHNFDEPLNFEGFYGGGLVYIRSSDTSTSVYRTQAATLDFSGLGSFYPIRFSNVSCEIRVFNLRFILDGSVTYGSLLFSGCLNAQAFYNSITGDGGTSGYGMSGQAGSVVYARQNIIDNQDRAFQVVLGGTLILRDNAGTNNATGYYTGGGSILHYSGTGLVGTTNSAGGLYVAPAGAILP